MRLLAIVIIICMAVYGIFWLTQASALRDTTEKNLTYYKTALEKEKNGSKFTYGNVIITGFPGLPKVSIENIEYSMRDYFYIYSVGVPKITARMAVGHMQMKIFMPDSFYVGRAAANRKTVIDVQILRVPYLEARHQEYQSRENVPEAVMNEFAYRNPEEILFTLINREASYNVPYVFKPQQVLAWRPVPGNYSFLLKRLWDEFHQLMQHSDQYRRISGENGGAY